MSGIADLKAALSPAATELFDLLSDRTKRVYRASNGRWYVDGRAGQVKESAVDQLIAAGHLIAQDNTCEWYRRRV